MRSWISRSVIALLLLSFLAMALPYGTVGLNHGMDTDLGSVQASFNGEEAWDNLGNDTAIVGDVNGDGFDDMLIGAPNRDSLSDDDGVTYLIFGKESGWSGDQDISSSDASFVGENEGDISGSTVAGAGDVNGDGYDDLLIGAMLNDENGESAGQTYLIFGKEDGWFQGESLADADASFLGEYEYDVSAIGVAGVGDVNGDGFDDFAIGAYGNSEGGLVTGQVYLFLGKASGWDMDTNLSQADASFIGEHSVSWFGSRLACAGDVNGDDFDDFLIGAWNDDEGGGDPYQKKGAGQVYLILGKPDGWSMDTPISNAAASYIGEGPANLAGFDLAAGGDVNGDGLDDIIIGAPNNDRGGGSSDAKTGAGAIYVIFGNTSGWSLDNDLSDADVIITGEFAADNLGWAVDGGGDVNGDGLDDIVIGALGNAEAGGSSGQTYLIPGTDASWPSLENIQIMARASYLGEAPGDFSGMSVSTGGDMDGDGYDDILISSPANSDHFLSAGKVYLISPDTNSPPLGIESIKTYADPSCSEEIIDADVNDKVYVELIGIDGNSSRVDVAVVNVKNDDTGSKALTLRLYETGLDTGRYRGEFTLSDRTHEGNGLLEAEHGELVNVTSPQDQTYYCTVLVGYFQIAILDMTPSNVSIDEGDMVNITVKVSNLGVIDLMGIRVDFIEENDKAPGNVTVFATRYVDIEASGFVNVSVDWNSTGKLGIYHLTAHADPGDEIKEIDESDNMFTIDITIGELAELKVTHSEKFERRNEVHIFIENSKGGFGTHLEVLYPNGTVLFEEDVILNPFGSAYRSIDIRLDFPLGTYIVNVSYNKSINISSFEVVNEPPMISSPPDMTFIEGTEGNVIEWECQDMNPYNYTLIVDGERWNSVWREDYIRENVDHLSPGIHNVTLEIIDRPGNTANDTVIVTVLPSNQPPEVVIASPMSGATVRGLITITGTATDPEGNLTSVEILVDDGLPVKVDGTDEWSFQLDTWDHPNGYYTIVVRAVDGEGLADTASITLGIDNTIIVYETAPDKGITTPLSVSVMSLTIVAALGVGLASTDMGRWGLFKLLFLAGYAKRKDEKVLDNFLRGIILGVIIRDPGVRPIDVADGIEGGYANSLIYYHIHELIKFGYINMVQRNRQGKIVKSWKGIEGKMRVNDRPDKDLTETELTMRASNLEGMSLHLYPSGTVAPESQVSIRRKQRFMVYKYIAENPGLSLKEIAEGLDMVRQGISYHLKELKKDGLLIVGTQGRRRYYYIDKGKAVDLRGDVTKAPVPAHDMASMAARDGR